MALDWRCCDLSVWGEYLNTVSGTYRKTWIYTDQADNNDGLWFYVSGPSGWRRGPFESEAEIDEMVALREGLTGG
jgi:hypothetical protein